MEDEQTTGGRHNYETVSEAVDDLVKRGYTTDFLIRADEDRITCSKSAVSLSPEEFEIDEIYRFEGMTDPADETIIYAISSPKHQMKGIVVNGFGADFGYRSSKLVEYLNRHL